MYVSIEGQGHFFTIYFPGFVCFVLYWAKISGERYQDYWSSGLRLGFFFSNWEKSYLNSIGKGAEIRPLRTPKKILALYFFFFFLHMHQTGFLMT